MKMLGFTAGASARGGTPSNARGAELGLRLVKDREGLWGVILESEIVSKVSRGGFSVSQQAGGGEVCAYSPPFFIIRITEEFDFSRGSAVWLKRGV